MKSKFNLTQPLQVVDLHINKLLDSYSSLTGSEIITYQLNYCKQCIDNAIVYDFTRMVVIHGVGNGVLKKEVLKLLKSYPAIKDFCDAPIEKFGLGATEIIFK